MRWAIQRQGQVPMAIAGIYRTWKSPAGEQLNSFAMLTVNADGHPVMSKFHAPGEEKRMVVILKDDEEIDDWLTCSVAEAKRYFQQYLGPLDAYPAPLQPRGG